MVNSTTTATLMANSNQTILNKQISGPLNTIGKQTAPDTHHRSGHPFLQSTQIAFVPPEQNLQVGGNVVNHDLVGGLPEIPGLILAITGFTMVIPDHHSAIIWVFPYKLFNQFLVISNYSEFFTLTQCLSKSLNFSLHVQTFVRLCAHHMNCID